MIIHKGSASKSTWFFISESLYFRLIVETDLILRFMSPTHNLYSTWDHLDPIKTLVATFTLHWYDLNYSGYRLFQQQCVSYIYYTQICNTRSIVSPYSYSHIASEWNGYLIKTIHINKSTIAEDTELKSIEAI